MYHGKRVLVTGHTGFKGSWLCIWLKKLMADVIGYALEPHTDRDNFVVTGLKEKMTHIIGDVRDYEGLQKVFATYNPEIVFHLAAQPLVLESYSNPKETYDINIGGTVNVLECCRMTDSVRVIVNVTSDKCYENKEWIWGYRENDAMGGYDPYSSSKACSELVTTAFRNSFFNPDNFPAHQKSLSSVRAGNVIGGGDWQENRVIPDCIKALLNNRPVEIRNPHAVRPWQHVLEPLGGYLELAHQMYEKPRRFCGSWNFGPHPGSFVPVAVVVDKVIDNWGSGSWIDGSTKQAPHESRMLCLDTSKARTYLNWSPVWDLEKAIKRTVEWYQGYDQKDPYGICMDQIQEFTTLTEGASENDRYSGRYSMRGAGYAS